eukprot:TRINITY_DN24386_c0_g1_i1.p1 TRINITY_DN24386_c0_g1~~TRINITY_DN24386_c0_g1_i1.p1  ORF type:complete len:291 (+),score=52.47 TRINITY_DN24386_c0_g1_i1:64-936(+)
MCIRDRYMGTAKGLFSVWDTETLQKLYSKSFFRDTLGMTVCKNSNKIIIGFDTDILVLSSLQQTGYIVINSFQLKYKSSISDFKISYNEKLIAVALAPSPDSNARIELYEIEDETKTFKLLCLVDNLTSSVEFLDFSTDNFYLLYKDYFAEITIIDLSTMNRINTLFVEFDIEWISDGIKISDKTKGVGAHYSDDNRVIRMVRIGDKTLAVTDEMGTIRLFDYPCEGGPGNGYYRCYSDHLNFVNQIVVSNDKTLVLTCSELDKCLVLWRIVKNDIEDHIVEDKDQGAQQ